MGLNTFIEVNLPYGMKKTNEKEWIVFNREKQPLGWIKPEPHSISHEPEKFVDFPIVTRYATMTDEIISEIVHDETLLIRNAENEIDIVYFYDTATNPLKGEKDLDNYLEKLKQLSKFETRYPKNDPRYQDGFLKGKNPTA